MYSILKESSPPDSVGMGATSARSPSVRRLASSHPTEVVSTPMGLGLPVAASKPTAVSSHPGCVGAQTQLLGNPGRGSPPPLAPPLIISNHERQQNLLSDCANGLKEEHHVDRRKSGGVIVSVCRCQYILSMTQQHGPETKLQVSPDDAVNAAPDLKVPRKCYKLQLVLTRICLVVLTSFLVFFSGAS